MAYDKNLETISPSRRWLRRTGCTNRPEFDHTLPLLGHQPDYEPRAIRYTTDATAEVGKSRDEACTCTMSRDRMSRDRAVPEVHPGDVNTDFGWLPPIQTRRAMGKYHRKGYSQVVYGLRPQDNLPCIGQHRDPLAIAAQDTRYQRLQTPSDPMHVKNFHVQILESDHFKNRFDSVRHKLTDAHMRAMKMLLGLGESDAIPGFAYPVSDEPSPVATKAGNNKRKRHATRVKNKERR